MTAVTPITDPLTRMQARSLAVRLHSTGSWTYGDIQRYLIRRGHPVSWDTVKRWADPAYDEQRRIRVRHAMRSKTSTTGDGSLGHTHHTAEFRMTRMRALRETAGLSPQAIARLMLFDYGDTLSPSQVEYALRVGHYPKRLERDPVAA